MEKELFENALKQKRY